MYLTRFGNLMDRELMNFFSLSDNYRLKKEDQATILEIDLPGVKHEDLSVKYDNGYLTIQTSKDRHYKESFKLANVIDGEKISAKLELGVLTVTLPYKESAQSKTIAVT